jgi:long-chain acyl-CoA synthetase
VRESFADWAHLHHLVDATQEELTLRSLPDARAVDGCGDRIFRGLSPAFLRFTSGTTHERRGVVLGHRAILDRLAAANRGLAVERGDRILWLLPMAHHFVVSILLYLRYGATVLLPGGSLARQVLAFGERSRPTLLYASPYHFALLAKDSSDMGLSGLRLAVSTSSALPRETAERFRGRFGLSVVQALGIMEVGLPVMNLGDVSSPSKATALGRPLPDYEVWLRGEAGERIGARGPEHTGEICIRGPGLFDAYLEPWILARDLVGEAGFATGDQGWFDADGDLNLAGRRVNRINMAGMKFFAEEVEAVLEAHPAVKQCRVRGEPHAHLGEIPVAEIVALSAGSPPERAELVRFCRERLPAFKVPRRILEVASLPTTATGKLQRWSPGENVRSSPRS